MDHEMNLELFRMPFQALKCHTALCMGGTEVPLVEARSQLSLSRLLLQHTHNAGDARQHLERAVCAVISDLIGLHVNLHASCLCRLQRGGLSRHAFDVLSSSCCLEGPSSASACAARLPASLLGVRAYLGRSACRSRPLPKPWSFVRAPEAQQTGKRASLNLCNIITQWAYCCRCS